MPSGHCHAVVFDLYGTLVPGGSRARRDETSYDMADVLGVDRERFARATRDSFDARTRGTTGELEATVRDLAVQCGAEPTPDQVAEACALRLALTAELLQDTWALPVLGGLRARGLPVGVLTDCSDETPRVWESSPLAALVDVARFSCRLGVRKPEAAAYQAVLDALGVEPDHVLYVGDGASDELHGAQAAGLRPVLLVPDEFDGVDRPGREHWDGERVHRLEQLLPLVDAWR